MIISEYRDGALPGLEPKRPYVIVRWTLLAFGTGTSRPKSLLDFIQLRKPSALVHIDMGVVYVSLQSNHVMV
jgi:hypothetical protein